MMKNLILAAILLFPAPALYAETLQLRRIATVSADAAGVKILQPEGVGCREKSLLVVSDTGNGRLQPYALGDDGSIKPGTEIKVPYPMHVRMNSKKEIFVLDGKQHRILRFSPTGDPLGNFEPADLPAPAAWIPKNFAIDANDNVYILDIFSGRVIVAGPDAKFQRQIPFPASNGFFSDVTVDAQGTVYLLSSVHAALFTAARDAAVFTPLTKDLGDHVAFPTSMAVDKKYIFIVDQNGGEVVVLGKDGSFKGRKIRMGWKEGELRYPADICLNDNGQVFVADRGNNLVEVYQMEGAHE
jgi:DNA-binding beta-propeller fold protein YncE